MRALPLVVALLAATTAAAAPISVPTTKFTLKNGMTVVLNEDHSVPRVHFGLRFGVGQAKARVLVVKHALTKGFALAGAGYGSLKKGFN